MQNISPSELHALGAEATIIDVREPSEVAEVRIPSALSIPLSEFTERIAEVPAEGAYIMCHAGGRSARAVQYLEQIGISAINVDGGISAWEAQGLPVERG